MYIYLYLLSIFAKDKR